MSTITFDNNMNKNELIRQYKHSNLIIGPDNDMFDLGLDGIDLLYFSLSGELEVKDKNGIIGSFSVDDPNGDFISVAEVKKFTSDMKQKFVCIPDFTGTIELESHIQAPDQEETIVVKGSHEFTIQCETCRSAKAEDFSQQDSINKENQREKNGKTNYCKKQGTPQETY